MAARDPASRCRAAPPAPVLDRLEAPPPSRQGRLTCPASSPAPTTKRRSSSATSSQALNDARFDPADEDSFAAAGPLLKRLANNRDFLADIALAELKDRCTRQSLENRYSSQVIMLHRASEKYFIRANFWPSRARQRVQGERHLALLLPRPARP